MTRHSLPGAILAIVGVGVSLGSIQQRPASYTVGVRSFDGGGPQTRGVALRVPSSVPVNGGASFDVTLTNTGAPAPVDVSLHSQDASAYTGSDVYRLSANVTGQGWTARIQNALAAVKFGESVKIPVHAIRGAGASASATVTFTAVSESDPSKTTTVKIALTARGRNAR